MPLLLFPGSRMPPIRRPRLSAPGAFALLSVLLGLPSLLGAPPLVSFSNGNVADANDINANFSALDGRLSTAESTLGGVPLLATPNTFTAANTFGSVAASELVLSGALKGGVRLLANDDVERTCSTGTCTWGTVTLTPGTWVVWSSALHWVAADGLKWSRFGMTDHTGWEYFYGNHGIRRHDMRVYTVPTGQTKVVGFAVTYYDAPIKDRYIQTLALRLD